jgi:hypothetical protein
MEENRYRAEQEGICEKYNQYFSCVDFNLKIGISINFNSDVMPLNGLRHYPKGDTSGWYIWSGEYSESDDFFKPMHIYHLIEIYPDILKYLGLPPGNRFLIDNLGYEDVWFDESMLVI